MNNSHTTHRRAFLQAAASASLLTTSLANAQPDSAPPSDRIPVGVIGVGQWGRDEILLKRLLPNETIEVAAICDVDGDARQRAAQDVFERAGRRPFLTGDYRALCDRDDLVAVVVATPDHWHALCVVEALESGKHVFCESPLANTAADARAIVDASLLWKRTFQLNLSKRADPLYRTACHNARYRRLGRLTRAEVTLAPIAPPTWSESTQAPPGLDWSQWLGPAPVSEFSASKLRGGFRWFADYSAGPLAAGADLIDIAVWGAGLELRSPRAVRVIERRYDPTSPYDVPRLFHVAFEFDAGFELHVRSADRDSVRFEGDAGNIAVGPGIQETSSLELREFIPARSERVADYGDVWESFWSALRFGRVLLIHAEAGYRAAALVDMAQIALRLNRGFAFVEGGDQPVDIQARRLLTRPLRAPHYLFGRSVSP